MDETLIGEAASWCSQPEATGATPPAANLGGRPILVTFTLTRTDACSGG
jgi:hypothetical protein